MNRSQRDLQNMLDEGERMAPAFLSEIGSVNKNLNLLCSRLDRLIMLLAIFAGSDLLLGNDLTGRIQHRQQSTNQERIQNDQSQASPEPQAR